MGCVPRENRRDYYSYDHVILLRRTQGRPHEQTQKDLLMPSQIQVCCYQDLA